MARYAYQNFVFSSYCLTMSFRGLTGRGTNALHRPFTDPPPNLPPESVNQRKFRLATRSSLNHFVRGILAGWFMLVVGTIGFGSIAWAQIPEQVEAKGSDLAELSLEELMNIEVTSVSKSPEKLLDAPAAIYVITQEDIRRSGVTSIAEALRLAPNLQVARVDASQYAITARGFNSTTANKLLVLIDGRSVYTPLYSGVFWDVQDVLLEDIDRIEVISGPGGTLWGANAVNGVINIITRHSRDTTGALVSVGGGPDERTAAARYGGRLGTGTTYRVYAKDFLRDNTLTESDLSLHDSWSKSQAGFRIDRDGSADALTFQGDIYDGSIDQTVIDDKTISGGNVVGRWSRTFQNGSALQTQVYYDRVRRDYPGTFAEVRDTYDLDLQHHIPLGARQDLVWGGGYRVSSDDVTNSAALAFLPAHRSLSLANIFFQDGISLHERLKLTVGTKLEHNDFTGWEVQPSARLAWKLSNALLWSAVSRAVRTPSRLDRDLFAPGAPPFFLAGGPDFESEKLTAYEIGYRVQPVSQMSLSISTFYNVYDKLRSLELAPGGVAPFGPFVLGNKMEGNTYGAEMWGSYRVLDWWRLSAGYNYLKKRLRFESDSSDTFGVKAAGNDPSHQFSARSTMNLARNLELDAAVRVIGGLPDPNIPGYVALDMRLGWTVLKSVEVSLSGFNLLDQRHPEFGTDPTRSELDRTFYARLVWNL
jgi:iron complex outermembrane receptor protein